MFDGSLQHPYNPNMREPLEVRVGRLLRHMNHTLAVAESCTGGLLGGTITRVPGSSAYFLGGVIAYHNRIKQDVLNVPEALLNHFGAVSEPVAILMAEGVRLRFVADMGVGITGIAGPTGGTPEKPVGLVWIGLSLHGRTRAFRHRFEGDREAIRQQSVRAALRHILDLLEPLEPGKEEDEDV